jgi:hypothetical protein
MDWFVRGGVVSGLSEGGGVKDSEEQEGRRLLGVTGQQWRVVGVVMAFVAGALIYKFLMHERLGHTSAMFLGLPAMLAILLALMPKAKSATGAILKGITLFLLIVAPLVGEGYLCIVIASPLFYLVGALIGVLVDHFRAKRTATLSCVVLVLLPICSEGVIPQVTFDRSQMVEVTRMVNEPVGEVEARLGRSPRVGTPIPAAYKVGFPRPLAAWGEGLAVGDLRTIRFSGAEGDPEGNLVMRVSERRQGYARFEAVSDGSKLTQWLRWRDSVVTWNAVDAGHTRVTWRIDYERGLDPAWYFGVWERVCVTEAAKFLIEANA